MQDKSTLIDGQQLYFLSDESWVKLFETRLFHDKPVSESLIKKLSIDLSLSRKYPELTVALGYVGVKNFLFPYALFNKDDSFQRVYIERVHCSHCFWKGYAASSSVPEIYYGISQECSSQQLMLKAREHFENVNCPNCSMPFNRSFIWVEKA